MSFLHCRDRMSFDMRVSMILAKHLPVQDMGKCFANAFEKSNYYLRLYPTFRIAFFTENPVCDIIGTEC